MTDGRTLRVRLGAACIAAAVVFTCGSSWAQEVTLKFAHVQPETHAFHKGAEKFAEELKALSNGTMNVQLFANGVMGNERDLLEALQIGSVDVITVTSALTGTFDEKYQVFSLPFLFDGYEHAFQAMDDKDIRETLEPDLIAKGIRPIGYWIGGARSYYGTKPVEAAKALSGRKVRTMEEPIYLQTWKELGTIPTPLPFGEVYTALQSGMVDGAEGAINSYVSRKFYEVAPNVAFIEYVFSVQMLHISDLTWQRLTDEQRGWVTEAAARATKLEREYVLDEDERLAQTLKDLKVNVTKPDAKPFRGAIQPVYDAFRAEVGEETQALILKVEALAKE